MEHVQSYAMAALPLDVCAAIDGVDAEARSEAAVVASFVVVISTRLEDRGVELKSVYSGFPTLPTHVSHTCIATGCVEREVSSIPEEVLPAVYARRLCLFDHLVRLQALVDELGLGVLSIEVSEEAVAAVDAY